MGEVVRLGGGAERGERGEGSVARERAHERRPEPRGGAFWALCPLTTPLPRPLMPLIALGMAAAFAPWGLVITAYLAQEALSTENDPSPRSEK